MSLAARRSAAEYLQNYHDAGERRASWVLSLSRSTKRRQPDKEDRQLVEHIYTLSYHYPQFGYRKLWKLLTPEEKRMSRERVRLLRRREGLQVRRRRQKQRRIGRAPECRVRRNTRGTSGVMILSMTEQQTAKV